MEESLKSVQSILNYIFNNVNYEEDEELKEYILEYGIRDFKELAQLAEELEDLHEEKNN